MHTIKADNKRRVRLPDVKPGDVLAYENRGNGVLVLTEVKPVEAKPMKARLEKQGRYTVVVTDRPVDESLVKQILTDFP